jgi:DNA-binding response OmpR family regulator
LKRYASILLVEDDENDILFFRRALDSVGFDIPVQIAPDGAAAVAWLDQAKTQSDAPNFPKPSLVLLDLNLPRKAGLDVLKWIRRDAVWHQLTVIILTSSNSDIDCYDAYASGANSYVVKPNDGTKLRDLAVHLKDYWFSWNRFSPLQSPPRDFLFGLGEE